MQVFDGKYTAIETAKRLYNTEGLSKFWRGASVLASGCIPAHALYFSVYELSKRKFLPKLHDQNDKIYPYAYALTGILATSMHDLVLTPFDSKIWDLIGCIDPSNSVETKNTISSSRIKKFS